MNSVVGMPVKRTKEQYDLRYYAGMQQFQTLIGEHGYNLRSSKNKKSTMKRFNSAKDMVISSSVGPSNKTKRKKRMERQTKTPKRRVKKYAKLSSESMTESYESITNKSKKKRPASAIIRRSSSSFKESTKRPKSARVGKQRSYSKTLEDGSSKRTKEGIRVTLNGKGTADKRYNLRPRIKKK